MIVGGLITSAPAGGTTTTFAGGVDLQRRPGISRPSADIRYLELANSFVAIHNITLASTVAPEPSSFILLGPAMAGVLARRLRLFKNRKGTITFMRVNKNYWLAAFRHSSRNTVMVSSQTSVARCSECDGPWTECNRALAAGS